jgi:hypothetical protein
MSEASEREEMPDRPGPDGPGAAPDSAQGVGVGAGAGGPGTADGAGLDPVAPPGAGGTTGDAGGSGDDGGGPAAHERAADEGNGRGGHGRWSWGRKRDGAGARHGHGHGHDGHVVPTGLAASLVTSGGLLLAMVEDLRMRGEDSPAEVRPLADTFARHCAAKEATVRKVLERHGESARLVARDRQEGELIQGILDRALTGRHPEDTRHLTVDGALTQMYQYLIHERRDLVPAVERAVPFDESETLSAAFEAINHG